VALGGGVAALARDRGEPEEQVTDGKPRRQPYALPSEYGPAEPPPDTEATDDQSVRTLHRDSPAPVPVAAPAASRRERRQSRRARPPRVARGRPGRVTAKWIGAGVVIAVVVVVVALAWPSRGSDQPRIPSPAEGGAPHAIQVSGTTGAVPAATPPNAVTASQPLHLPPPTARVPTPAANVEPNEGIWMPAGRLVAGLPAEYVTFVRPDAAHTSFYVALMWLDTRLLRAEYVPGLREPGAGPNPWGSRIPEDERSMLVAAFNSGSGRNSARGGVYLQGEEVRPLVDRAASLVIRTDGSATVGQWNRDVTMGPDIASVRQSPELIVDRGQVTPELRGNRTTVPDTTAKDAYTWRSGVGVDANGALVYAGGNSVSARTLARTLQAAGAVRAMELDVDHDDVSAYTYVTPTNDPAAVVGRRLSRDMAAGGGRYLEPDDRDFFAFFADPAY
jgi:hypothetical protein